MKDYMSIISKIEEVSGNTAGISGLSAMILFILDVMRVVYLDATDNVFFIISAVCILIFALAVIILIGSTATEFLYKAYLQHFRQGDIK